MFEDDDLALDELNEDDLANVLAEKSPTFVDNLCDRLRVTFNGRQIIEAFARNASKP